MIVHVLLGIQNVQVDGKIQDVFFEQALRHTDVMLKTCYNMVPYHTTICIDLSEQFFGFACLFSNVTILMYINVYY